LSKFKHYTTQYVRKVVYNSLFHPYVIYSILNCDRDSNATFQLLITFQNKAVTLIRLTNHTSLEESSSKHVNHRMPSYTLFIRR